MKIRITMTIDPEYADPNHAMGVTAAGYDWICEGIGGLGADIDVEKA